VSLGLTVADVWTRQGNPISWRQLWKGLIMNPLVEPHVLRKRTDGAAEAGPTLSS
jgi:hypothetical protein